MPRTKKTEASDVQKPWTVWPHEKEVEPLFQKFLSQLLSTKGCHDQFLVVAERNGLIKVMKYEDCPSCEQRVPKEFSPLGISDFDERGDRYTRTCTGYLVIQNFYLHWQTRIEEKGCGVCKNHASLLSTGQGGSSS